MFRYYKDIYVNSKCLWSGCLEKPILTRESNPRTDLDNNRVLFDESGTYRVPSLTVSLSRHANLDTNASSVSERDNVTSLPSCRTTHGRLFIGGSDTNVDSKSISIASCPKDFDNGRNEPTWFAELKSQNAILDAGVVQEDLPYEIPCDYPVGNHRVVKRSKIPEHLENKFSSTIDCSKASHFEEENVIAFEGNVNSGLEDTKGNGSRRSRRRVDNHTCKQDKASVLQKSLEALSQSDLRNRGRIESELGNFAEVMNYDQISSSITKCGPDLSGLEKSVGDSLKKCEIEKQCALKERAERIGEVQETVSSTLQDLASVMSCLKLSKKNEDFSANVHSDPHQRIAPFGEKSIDELISPIEKGNVELANHEDVTNFVEAAQVSSDIMSGSNYLDCSLCEIPILPKGKQLELEILSTW